jgi:hypothetical protein
LPKAVESKLFDCVVGILRASRRLQEGEEIRDLLQKSEALTFILFATIVRCHDSLDRRVILAIVEWLLTAITNSHFHALDALALACSAIAEKDSESRDLLITTGLLPCDPTHSPDDRQTAVLGWHSHCACGLCRLLPRGCG